MIEQLNKLKWFWAILILMSLMLITRGHSNPLNTLIHLPDFTLPALFIAGVYLRNLLIPLSMIALAMGIDWYVISYNGVSNFCITDAYMMLIPAYMAMFIGGNLLNSLAINSIGSLAKVFFVVMITGFIEWFISSASFYWMAPYFTDPNWAGFMPRIEKYAPGAMLNLMKWMVAVVVVFTLNERYSVVSYFTSKNNHA